MATLTPYNVTRAGVVPAFAAVASGGDQFINDGKVVAWVENAHASAARTANAAVQRTLDGETVDPKSITISAAQDRKVFGPFPPEIYNDANGYVQLTYSDSGADMTICLLRIP